MSIQENRKDSCPLPVSRAATLLKIPRSGYYTWKKKFKKDRDKSEEDRTILEEIRRIVEEFSGYGYRRVKWELRNRGFRVNHKRIQRLMRENGLLCKKGRRFRLITTDSDHDNPIYPNLIKDMPITHLDQIWASDITYIELDHGFVYLATVLDVYTRKCIGWKLSRNIDAELVLEALNMAIKARWNPEMENPIHHSDRGVQYTSKKYVQCLEKHNIQISMSRKGNPYDNAYAESFFKTLKCEEVYLNEYKDINEAWKYISRFIEDVYNLKRLHSSLGYKSPIDFEMEVNLNSVA